MGLAQQLRKAAADGDANGVRQLLARGAPIEAKDRDGYTALLRATANGHVAVVELLLNNGAQIEAKENFGYTPLITAAYGIHHTHADIVQLLLARGAQVDAKTDWGGTALMTASCWGAVHIVEALLKNGAQIEAKDKDGKTALMEAATRGHAKVVELLLERGASVHPSDALGNTAMHHAARPFNEKWRQEEKYQVFGVLRRAGADPSKENRKGETPLSLLPQASAIAPQPRATSSRPPNPTPTPPLSDLQQLWVSAQTAPVALQKLLQTLAADCVHSFDDFVLAHNLLLLAFRQRVIPVHKLRMLGGSRDFVFKQVYLPVSKLQLSDEHKLWLSRVLLYAERVGFIRDGHATLIDIVAELRSEIRQTRLEMHTALVTVARKINHLENRVDQLDDWTRQASKKFQQLCEGQQQMHDDMLKMATSLRDLHHLLKKQQRNRTIAGILSFGLSMIPVLGAALAGATFAASEVALGINVEQATSGASTAVTEMLAVDINNFRTVTVLTSEQCVAKLDPVVRQRLENVVEQTEFQTVANLHHQLSVTIVELDHTDVHLTVTEEEEEALRQRFRALVSGNSDESVSAEDAMNELQHVLRTTLAREVDIDQIGDVVIRHMNQRTACVELDAFLCAFYELKSKFPATKTRQVPAELRQRFRAAVKQKKQLRTLFAKPLLRELFRDSGADGGLIVSFRRTKNDWDEQQVDQLLKEHAVDDGHRLIDEDGFIAVGMEVLFGEG